MNEPLIFFQLAGSNNFNETFDDLLLNNLTTTLITSDDDEAQKIILSDDETTLGTDKPDKPDKTDKPDKRDDKQFAKGVNDKNIQRLQSELNINDKNVVAVVRTSFESGSPMLKALRTS